MENNIVVGGKKFPPDVFQKLMNVFIEAFSYSSLSVEQAFSEIKEYEQKIKTICDRNADSFNIYQSLSDDVKDIVKYNIKFMTCCISARRGYFSVDVNNKNDVNDKFNANFPELLDYIPYLPKFNSNGEFDFKATYQDLSDMMALAGLKRIAENEATNMKKDYINAFGYALSLDHIGIQEIKEINAKVNENSSNATEPGVYKRVNNAINGATFVPCDKELVPTKMEELIYNYNNNWGDPIEPINYDNASTKEKHDFWKKIAEREARFHIEFERIHPFEDGNGRTGRIILNTHLLKNTMAPILITGAISKDYKKRINDRDYEGFADDITSWSSQVLTTWISELRLSQAVPIDRVGFKYPFVGTDEDNYTPVLDDDLFCAEDEDTSGDGSRK